MDNSYGNNSQTSYQLPKDEHTFLTSIPRTKHELDPTIPNSDAINSLYSQINSCISGLDNQVGKVLQKHEADFLNVYKGHMYMIQKEMRILKEKVSEEEIKRRRDEELRVLETERDWFRNEALRLDKICKEYKRSMEMWKNKAQTLEEDRKFMEEQVLSTKKQNLHLRENLESNMSHPPDFTLSSPRSEDMDPLAIERGDSLDAGRESKDYKKYMSAAPFITMQDLKKVEERYNETIKHLKNQIDILKKSLHAQKSAQSNYVLEKGELEDFFIQCIEEVKKEITKRRSLSLLHARNKMPNTTSSKSLRSAKSIEVSEEIKLDQFKDCDKRKVLEMLVCNEEVLALFHDRIFPQTRERPNTNMSSKRVKSSASSSNLLNTHGLSSHVFSIPAFSDKKRGLMRPSTAPRGWFKS
ncbi:unnamed protein product [Blepharisma stoltei]|uniref:Uncharacterized protein n=1 Tax=Blepharisma stoltei TaxID=1481888 RepID=A0AAU9J6Q7_9CILI|nr:unnamed protein product [Blepharisma stoltei]